MTPKDFKRLLAPSTSPASDRPLDAAGHARKLAGGNTDYRNKTKRESAGVLGVKSHALREAPLWPVEGRRALHWAVARSLTREAKDYGAMSFQPRLTAGWCRASSAQAGRQERIVLSDCAVDRAAGRLTPEPGCR